MVDSPSAAFRASSFHTPMLLLPRQKRQDMQVLYAFCRALDDAVDDAPDKATALRNLDEWEQEIDRIFLERTPQHPIARAFLTMHARIQFAQTDVRDMLASMRMDAEGKMYYPALGELERYCYGAASCAGLMSMRIFGCEGEEARHFAIHLGHALQLTNIGRDILADARQERIYLAAEWVPGTQPSASEILADTTLVAPALHHLSNAAQRHYTAVEHYARMLPVRAIAPALAMRDVYRHYHFQLKQRGHVPPGSGKLRVTAGQRGRMTLRAIGYLFGI